MRTAWTPEEEARLLASPYNYEQFNLDNPNGRSRKAFQIKRGMMGIGVTTQMRIRGGEDSSPRILWDKKDTPESLSWEDYIAPMEAAQALHAEIGRSQDRASIIIESTSPTAIAFVSDWHIGSWGVGAAAIRDGTHRLLRLHRERGLYIAVLGDMLEMAIRLRSMAEINGNLLTPAQQIGFLKLWMREMAPAILWATWDNHAVQREEEVTGYSVYAEIFKDHTIYHSGLGHTDLTVGNETYLIATSHRFRGRSALNPLSGQMRYMQRESPDREVVVGGDSHQPAIMQYHDGGKTRTVANCGTLQTDSTYAKRHFSLHTSTAMPVLVFHPTQHIVVPYHSLDHYESSLT